MADSMCLHPLLSSSLTCALKQTNFTGDLLVEDNDTDRFRSERARRPFTKRLMRPVEESGGCLQVHWDEEPGGKEMLNTFSPLWTYGLTETRRYCP